MFQVDQPTAAASLPAPAAAGTQGYFTNGNPATGVAATILDADFMNMVMLELSNVVTGAGLTLSKTTYNQVLSAIKRIGQNTVVLADTGAANAYAAINATPLVAGTWVDGVVQAVKIAHANTGASTYAPDGLPAIPIYGLGLQPLQGSELALNGTAILMRTTIAGVNSGNPICVLMECAGGAQQVVVGSQSNHAVNLGQFGNSLIGNGYQKLAGGLILQWGSVTQSSAQNVGVTFPIAFPNSVLNTGVSSSNSTGTNNGASTYGPGLGGMSVALNGNYSFTCDDSPVPNGVTAIEITDAQWQSCISEIGYSVRDGVLVAPTESEVSKRQAAGAWSSYQASAKTELDSSDLTILRCYENGIPVPSEWATYRKLLRAVIGAASGDPTQPLPMRPQFPAGT
ncbi:conserved hypothetical protein [Ricinus communis]|uniref:Putative tail fiber protein gp53-like C-terminal domain-containing protein n=1 Tax=Ricinus communis TaxID=3988 RepID=B9TBC9_RICCO|nr:conserved hypothetical protein [Ricinus communis]